MSKSFSEHERNIIKEKLIESCEECWSKYGYKKTSVGELCKMAGISTGAFYLFYPSKEMLFLDTVEHVSNRIYGRMDRYIPQNPTKNDLAKGLKEVFKEIEKVQWIMSIGSELELLLRKFPPDFLDKDFQNDKERLAQVISKFHLKPKKSLDMIVSIVNVLFMSLLHKKNFGDKYDEAIDFIIDTVIDNLFE